MKIGRKTKVLLVVVVALAALTVGAWHWRAPLLLKAGRLWIVSDAPTQADAIVILGGNADNRPLLAARLYREGWSKHVLVLSPESSVAAERGLVANTATTTCKLLESEQVPADALETIGEGVRNTHDEAKAIAVWAHEHGARRLLVPTDLFHTRRSRWILSRALKGEHVEVLMIPVTPRAYAATNWWRTDQGVVDFQNEVLKYFYYRLKY